MTQSIALDTLSLYPEFLTNGANVPGLLTHGAVPPADDLRDLSRFTPDRRAALVDAITGDLQRWEAPEEARRVAERLREADTYAVVTGQQAGIATGPLYTLVKAVGVVEEARRLGERFPDRAFVPVFWIEADDHDFDEARTIAVIDKAGDARTLRYDDGDERRLPVGERMVSAEGRARLIEELRELLPATDFTENLLATFETAYGDGRNLADGFARSMYAFLGDTALVLVSSRNAGLKRLAADVFAREAEDPSPLHDALTRQSEELRAAGLPTPIDPKLGALFIVADDGERRSLDPEGESYVVRGTDTRMSRREIVALANESPERLSPNVALRPLVQDAILPTALYLGGPSEVAYQLQLREAYGTFGLSAPLVGPRPFVLLLESKVARAIESAGLSLEQIIDPGFSPTGWLADEEEERKLEETVARAMSKLNEAFAELEGATATIDASLEKALGAGARKAEKEIENIHGRLRSALKRRNETEIRRLEAARELVLPGGNLQERTLSPLYFADKYGIEGFRAALSKIEPAGVGVQVIPLLS